MVAKTKVLSLRVSAGERRVIESLCAEYGMSMTDLLVRESLRAFIWASVADGDVASEKRARELSRMLLMRGVDEVDRNV